MFPIDFIQQERGALPVITGNRRDILFEEVPILFTGTNDFGGFIVGSSIDEDYDQGIEWYFHVVVTKEKFLDYTGGNVAYRQLLETSPYVYVLEKYVNTSEEIYYQINFETVPDEYKPLPNSFFPSYKAQPSVLYEACLTGNLANYHLASPQDAFQNQLSSAGLFENALAVLHYHHRIQAQIWCRPATAASYDLNYEIQFGTNLFAQQEGSIEFINAYLSYLLGAFADEVSNLVQKRFDKTPEFNRVFEILLSIGLPQQNPDEDISTVKEALLESVFKTAPHLSTLAKHIGKNYTQFSINNVSNLGSQPLGTVDASFKDTTRIIEAVVAEVEPVANEQTTEDEQNRVYKVRVYDFNKRSGKGKVDVKEIADHAETEKPEIKADLDDVDDVVRSVWLHVHNFKKKRWSILRYTQSMHEDQYITVIGKAKRKPDGTIVSIEVDEA